MRSRADGILVADAFSIDSLSTKLLDVRSRKKIDGIVEILPMFIQAVESEESKVIANRNIDKVFAEGMQSAPSGSQASLDRDVHGALEPRRPALKRRPAMSYTHLHI